MSHFPTEYALCSQEPIHIPGAIQPFGALVVLDPASLHVLQRSANAPALLSHSMDLNEPFSADPALATRLRAWQSADQDHARWEVMRPAGRFQLDAYRTRQGVLLAFEPLPEAPDIAIDPAYDDLRDLISRLEPVSSIQEVGAIIARHVRAMTGFNRTLIYRFDPDWNGTVIAEDGDGVLPSYLDLRFPASDIPAQARALYTSNRLRLIPDADYTPVAIAPVVSPLDGRPLDLGPVALRSVSPLHLRYMRNMGTQASMSISLVVDGRLWGLISCHHQTARQVCPRMRAVCDFLGQLAAQQIATRERMSDIGQRVALKRRETELLVKLARAESFQQGLAAHADLWLSLTNATGAAVVQGDEVWLAGITPSPPEIGELAKWLRLHASRPVFATSALAAEWPDGDRLAAEASGVLAIAISQLHPSYIIWFREEMIHTVNWAGDPRKPADPPASSPQAAPPQGLSPRTSFEQWKQTVRGQALPWQAAEIEAAGDFRNAIIDFVLRHAEVRAEMTDKLQNANRELEAFSYSVSHDLRAPFRHIVGYAELLRDRLQEPDETSQRFLATIRDAALSAGRLVDDLLAFSQLNRASLRIARIDMNKLVAEARTSVMQGVGQRRIDWQVGSLPEAWGDPSLLRQALLNLLSNAVKYTGRRDQARIEIAGHADEACTTYVIRDNGIGFDMRYVGKLFGVFQRLHRIEDFEGTGIGLALTKRVIDRHDGWIRAEAVIDEGATFTFGLPRRPQETSSA